ncbi:EamA family transporter [Pseudogulbenkiania ferrooxidans]|uniref:EamA domain-containing protein n=1 Tax=Pseudogulbenkiania ferrooxidans 2002 TaxID=279714 RepID=B9Z2V4_9NEIS|nr:EamA family transporter [Pseudogulbenkiania ferrooxidans]EEG08907.1 protein of unknown function DUF6, transmembrane [Pseudogulbenkiania ferrooxidans 2002]
MSLFALLLAVAGSVIYHLSLKQVPQTVNPFFTLAVSYGVAMLLCLIGMQFSPGNRSLLALNWSSSGVALGILGIELGFLLAYRAGWQMGVASLSANVISTLVLLPLGFLLFREQPSLLRLGGAGLSLAGLWLMLQK